MFPAILQRYESVLCIVGHAEILLSDVLDWINCTLLIGDCWISLCRRSHGLRIGKLRERSSIWNTTTTEYNKQTSVHVAFISHIRSATLRAQRAQRAQACVPPPPPLLGSSSSLSSSILSSSATPCIHGITCLLKHIEAKPQGKIISDECKAKKTSANANPVLLTFHPKMHGDFLQDTQHAGQSKAVTSHQDWMILVPSVSKMTTFRKTWYAAKCDWRSTHWNHV